jgi:phage shock protein A
MGLFQRVTDILSASVNELIDEYEDPELLLKQAVREMEQSIRSALEHAVKVVAHEKVLARQLADAESAACVWRQRAEAAVRRGDDCVARDALRHKRDRDSVAAALAKQLAEASEAGQALRRQIESMRLRVDDAKRKLAVLAARQRAAEARRRLLREFGNQPLGENAFQKFDRMCRKVAQTEAEADAWAELSGDAAAIAELPNASDDASNDVEAELRELKAQCGT